MVQRKKYEGLYVTTLPLAPKVADKLKQQASSLGLSLSSYIRMVLMQSIYKAERRA